MTEIKNLSAENLGDFILLLKQRGAAPVEFYKWKYIDTAEPDLSSAYLAYQENKLAGCIGKINKVLVDKEGNTSAATWFADWYTTAESRGTGAGKALMQKVADSAPTGIGIPGPAHAQAVAAKSGYQLLTGFAEIQIPLSPWRVGYKKFNGSIIRKLLRGLREISTASFVTIISRQQCEGRLQQGFPPVANWLTAVEKGLSGKVHFQRSRAFLEWFAHMPLNEKAGRQWWYYSSPAMFAAGFTETDARGLKRARIMELIDFDNNITVSLKHVFCLLTNSGADIVVMLTENKVCHALRIPAKWRTGLPLYITLAAKVSPGYLSLMDKESSWREIVFN